jgi:hypothetical protein
VDIVVARGLIGLHKQGCFIQGGVFFLLLDMVIDAISDKASADKEADDDEKQDAQNDQKFEQGEAFTSHVCPLVCERRSPI